jgi:hypothetical protein
MIGSFVKEWRRVGNQKPIAWMCNISVFSSTMEKRKRNLEE